MLPDPARSNADDLAQEARTERLLGEQGKRFDVGYRRMAREAVTGYADGLASTPGPIAKELLYKQVIKLVGIYAGMGLRSDDMWEVVQGLQEGLREVGAL